MPKNTSWGSVADWYDHLLEEGDGTYQKEVILPNLQRLLAIKKGETVLDLGCGTGFFARACATAGAKVIAVDSGRELIVKAKSYPAEGIEYCVANAEKIPMVKSESVDKIIIILAIQNIEKINDLLAECQRVLKKTGAIHIVMNHPAYRIPKASGWEWTNDQSVQFRRVDRYLSEAGNKIDMHPGEAKKTITYSFHRPLQVYFKALVKNTLFVVKLEEWISNRVGPKGKTFVALEQARKEIPLFLYLECRKM